MTCAGCGKELVGDIRHCVSNQPDEYGIATCRNGKCIGLRFCGYDCLNRCWRRNNQELVWVREVVVNGQVLEPERADELRAVAEAERIVSDFKWNGMMDES